MSKSNVDKIMLSRSLIISFNEAIPFTYSSVLVELSLRIKYRQALNVWIICAALNIQEQQQFKNKLNAATDIKHNITHSFENGRREKKSLLPCEKPEQCRKHSRKKKRWRRKTYSAELGWKKLNKWVKIPDRVPAPTSFHVRNGKHCHTGHLYRRRCEGNSCFSLCIGKHLLEPCQETKLATVASLFSLFTN